VVAHEELGPYKYLLRLLAHGPERDTHRAALARLAQYDTRRSAQLVRTLEEYLRHRGNVSATAEALYVHQNTLRQRLERIEQLTGIDLRGRDSLTLDLALRLAALEQGAERVHDLARLAGEAES
jgi:purine catabolism regulator